MTDGKKSAAPKFEVLLILIFLGGFLVWGMLKCTGSVENQPAAMVEKTPTPEAIIAEVKGDTMPESNPIDSLVAYLKAQMDTTVEKSTTPSPSAGTRLYVTIDALKLRSEPTLQGEVLGTLKLFQQVDYMNEFTDTTQQINLGKGMADEPWIKVRTPRGTVGWVYGAGVDFRKKKNELAQ